MKRCIPVLFLVTFIVILFWPIISHKQILYCCDNLLINIPSKQLLVENVYKGIFPLWNPYIGGGMPYLADINLGTLYPFNALYFFLEPFYALNLLVVLHIVIATVGMYAFARNLKLTSLSSVIASMSFGLSGTVMTYTNNTPMLFVASWLPWAALLFTQCVKRFLYSTFVGLVCVLVFQMLAGHPQLVFYSWLLYACLVFYYAQSRGRALKILSGAGIVVFFITSVQLIPFMELAIRSTRLGRGYDFASFGSFNPLYLIGLFIPILFGDPKNGTVWAGGGSVYGYIGLLTVLFVILLTRWTRKTKLYIMISFLTLFLSFGKYSPVFAIAYRLVPGIGLFRVPSHFLLLYTFSMSVLIGFMCEGLRTRGLSKTIQRILGLFALILGIGSTVLFFGSNAIWHQVSSIGKIFQKFETIGGYGAFDYITRSVSIHGICIAIVLGILVIFFMRKKHTLAVGIIGIVTGIELVLFGSFPLSTISPNMIERWQENQREFVTKIFSSLGFHNDRVYIDPSLFPNPIPAQVMQDRMPTEIFWQYEALRPNMLEPYHISTINAYSSMIVRSFGSYLSGGEQTDPTGISIHSFRDEKLFRTGVRFIVTRSGDMTYTMPVYTLRYQDNNRAIYERNDEESSSISTLMTYVSTNSWSMSSYSDIASVYPTSKIYYPGWNIYVDGELTPIIKDMGIFISIPLPSGSHQIEARYEPLSVTVGIVFTIVGIGMMFAMGIKIYQKQLIHILQSVSPELLVIMGVASLFGFTLFVHQKVLSFTFWKADRIVYYGALTNNSKFWSYWYHPGTTLEFAIFTKLFGEQIIYWQLFGIIVRFFASIGVGVLLFLLTKSITLGLMSSLLFVATPVGLDSVGWVSGHVPLLSLATMLFGMSAGLYGLEKKRNMIGLLGLILLVLGLFFDPWRGAPIILFVLYYLYHRHTMLHSIYKKYRYQIIFGVLLCITGFVFWQRQIISEMLIIKYILEHSFDLSSYVTKLKSIGNLVVSIVNMTVGIIVPIREHASTGEYERIIGRIGIFVMTGIGYLIVQNRKHISQTFFLTKFFLLWIVIFYIPHWLSEPRLTLGVTHRYMVMSSVGVIALASLGLYHIRRRRAIRYIIFISLLIIQITLTHMYYTQWQSFRSRAVTDTVWETMVERSDPQNAFYVIAGDHPVVADSIHYSGFSMPIWYIKQTDSLSFPVVSDDYPRIASYLCGIRPIPNIMNDTTVSLRTYPLSHVYGYAIGESGGVTDTSLQVRRILVDIAEKQGCDLK